MTGTPLILTPDGGTYDDNKPPRRRATDSGRLKVLSYWPQITTIIACALAFGVLKAQVDQNTSEIMRIRAASDVHAAYELQVAREMVTKNDLQQLRGELLEAIRQRR